MSFQVDVRGKKLTYKCFACLKLRNPVRNKPTIVSAVTAMVPQDNGQLAMQVNPVHICKWCHRWGNLRRKFVDATSLDPNFGKAPQPKAVIDPSTKMPNKAKRDGRPRRKGGKLALK